MLLPTLSLSLHLRLLDSWSVRSDLVVFIMYKTIIYNAANLWLTYMSLDCESNKLSYFLAESHGWESVVSKNKPSMIESTAVSIMFLHPVLRIPAT